MRVADATREGAAMTMPRRSAGIPAIMPRNTVGTPIAPTFTEQDVFDYLNDHPPLRGRRYVWAAPATVEAIEFLDAAHVVGRLDLPPEMLLVPLVCLVTIRGACVFHGMRGMAPSHIAALWLIFDAESGNLLHQPPAQLLSNFGEAIGSPAPCVAQDAELLVAEIAVTLYPAALRGACLCRRQHAGKFIRRAVAMDVCLAWCASASQGNRLVELARQRLHRDRVGLVRAGHPVGGQGAPVFARGCGEIEGCRNRA